MGVYLDSKKPFSIYGSEKKQPYFVDKTRLLSELLPLVEAGGNYVCITRPRRFGKTVMANMIAAYFEKGQDGSSLFEGLEISRLEPEGRHQNQHHVIFISCNEVPRKCSSYAPYIDRMESRLKKDLQHAFPDIEMDAEAALWDILDEIYETFEETFIFILDEWDYIFHQDFAKEDDRKSYIRFLSSLLKDKPYVAFAYMTGILPIAKYSSGSELNMFLEYTMASEEMFGDILGFTESEVDQLFDRFQLNQRNPKITRSDLKMWYDGYSAKSGSHIYNPRSIVAALTNNNLGNYWTSSGPYDEIYYYIDHNTDAVRDSLALMVSGIPVRANVREYAATAMNLTSKDEILSAMTVYGFLSFEKGCVRIPNRELMERFDDMLQKQPSLGYVHQLARESEKMLQATLNGDTAMMCSVLEFAHNTETPLLNYNSETELTAIVNLIYLAARDSYRIEREDKAGIGYVDFIFYPEIDRRADGIILELKVDHTVDEAIQQIKDKRYALNFEKMIGGIPQYTGRVLGVGIAYDKKSKEHTCKIEVLREALAPSM